MKRTLPAILGGLFAGLSVWFAQSMGVSFGAGAIAAGAGGFFGTFLGQMIVR